MHTFGWTDIDDIAIALAQTHPTRDPLTVRFTELRQLVQALDGFDADPEHHVNEQILEAIQANWCEEKQDLDRDDDAPGYTPNNPFR